MTRGKEKEALKQNKAYLKKCIVISFFVLITGFLAITGSILKNADANTSLIHIVISCLSLILVIIYAIFKCRDENITKHEIIIFLSSFFGSMCLYVFCADKTHVPLYILGILMISYFFDFGVSIFSACFFLEQSFFYFKSGYTYLLIDFLICFIASSLVYIIEIIYQKSAKEGKVMFGKNKDGISYLKTLAKELDKKENSSENLPENLSFDTPDIFKSINENEVLTAPEVLAEKENDCTNYLSENSPLLDALKEKKKSAYLHSMRIAYVAEIVTEKIGGNKDFARVIALYHEIGKMNLGDAVTETIDILTRENFPEFLIKAINEVISKDKPEFTTKESAIVAISDTVISTYFYLKKNMPDKAVPEKITDNVMSKFMLNGRLDSCSLSVKDCKDIKDSFVETLNNF